MVLLHAAACCCVLCVNRKHADEPHFSFTSANPNKPSHTSSSVVVHTNYSGFKNSCGTAGMLVLRLCLLIASAALALRPQRPSGCRGLTRLQAEKGVFSRLRSIFGGGSSAARKDAPSPAADVVKAQVLIIGAGAAGLACADELHRAGVNDIIVLEASDDVGGRIRTDKVEGFLLDRGFQVFIEQYPLAQRLFNYEDLKLREFRPGAIIRFENAFHTVSDPFRRPQDLLSSISTPIGTFQDKILVGLMSVLIRLKSLKEISKGLETDTQTYLEQKGLSSSMIDRFFTPFFQGIFLSTLSSQSSRMFDFVFKMFTEGYATLPEQGMGYLMQQIKNRLPPNSIVLNTRAISLKNGTVFTKDVCYKGEYTVIATEAPNAAELLRNTPQKDLIAIPFARKSTCLYFGIDGSPPISGPVLILNGGNKLPVEAFDTSVDDESRVRVNNVCFPSEVSASYAPPGKSLMSVTLVGDLEAVPDAVLERKTRDELSQWWGESAYDWKLLRIYRVPYAQPAQMVPYDFSGKSIELADGVYCCGDHRGTATLNGAIDSGLRTADAILRDMRDKAKLDS